MKKIFFVVAILLANLSISYAQTSAETAVLSSTDIYGSARVVGVNGAFGAMGGDYSSVLINPAGIGDYKRGEFVFTPSYESNSSSINNGGEISKDHFGFDQIGLVFSLGEGETFNRNNIILGYNKTNSFRNVYSHSETTVGSITSKFLEGTDGLTFEELSDYSYLAYDAGAIYVMDTISNIYTDDFIDGAKNDKSIQGTTKGHSGEFSIGWAGNYDKKLNFGIVFGIPTFNYEENRIVNQSYNDGSLRNNLTYTSFNKLNAIGFNLKLGANYSPNKKLRLGLAIHTPTVYQIENEYYNTIDYSTSVDNYSNYKESPYGDPKYDFVTPFKAIGSIGNIFRAGNVKGFVNVDFEHQNYGSVKYDLTDYSDDPLEIVSTEALNSQIQKDLKSVNIARLGGELAFKVFRLRGGFSYATSSFSDENNIGWSVGTGFSGNNSFIDFAYKVSNRDFNNDGELPVKTQSKRSLFAVTGGLRF